MEPRENLLRSLVDAPANVAIPWAEFDDDKLKGLMTLLKWPAGQREHVEFRVRVAISFCRFVLEQPQDPNQRAKVRKARAALAAKGARLLAEFDKVSRWTRGELQFDLEDQAKKDSTSITTLDDVEWRLRSMVDAFEASAAITYKPGPPEYGPHNLVMATLRSTYEELAGGSATHWKAPEPVPTSDFNERDVAASAFGTFARFLIGRLILRSMRGGSELCSNKPYGENARPEVLTKTDPNS